VLSPVRRYLWVGPTVPEAFGSNLGRNSSAAIVSSAAIRPVHDQLAAKIRSSDPTYAK
jgi:hypothetical protein